MSGKHSAKVRIVHRLEVLFVAVFPHGTPVFHFRPDVAENQAHGGVGHFLIIGQMPQRVEHAGVISVECQTGHTTRRRLPRGVAGTEAHEGHIHRSVVVDAHRHHGPRLHIVGLSAGGGLAHVGSHVGHIPRTGFVLHVVPLFGQHFLPFVKFMVAEHAHSYAHVFEHLGHETRFARGVVEKAAAEIIACRNGDVVGVDALERIECLHHPCGSGDVLCGIGQESCVEIVERNDGNGDRVAVGRTERGNGGDESGAQQRTGQKRVFHYGRRLNYAKRKIHRPRLVLGKGTHFLTARRHEARRKRFFSSSPPLCCRFRSCAEAFRRGRNPTKRGAFAHLPREICPKRGTFETKSPMTENIGHGAFRK